MPCETRAIIYAGVPAPSMPSTACNWFRSMANQSAWGGAPAVPLPADRSCCIQLQQWHAAHAAASKLQALPDRTTAPPNLLTIEAPAVPGSCLTSVTIGSPCLRGHRPVTAACAVGKQLQWLHWGTSTCTQQAQASTSAESGYATSPCFVTTSDGNLQGHTAAITGLLSIPSALQAWPCAGWVSSSADHTIKLWSDSSSVAASSEARSTKYMDGMQSAVKAVKPVRTLRHHDEVVTCLELVTLSHGKGLLASGSADKTICLSSLAPVATHMGIDSSRGNPKLSVLRGHDKRVTCLLSPSGPSESSSTTTSLLPSHLLLSGGLDGRVKVWDLSRGASSGAQVTLSSAPACVRGWKLDDPCKQLLSVWEPGSISTAGFGSPSTVAAVLSSGVYLIDARQDVPAACLCRYPRCQSQMQWGLLQAAASAGQLAVAHGRVVEVHDLRKLGSSLSLSSAPRLRLSAQPARPLTNLYMDAAKVVATALPVSSKKRQQVHVEQYKQLGPVYCWSAQDGQLLNSFCPAAMPSVQYSGYSNNTSDQSCTPCNDGVRKALSFVPCVWPPCGTAPTPAIQSTEDVGTTPTQGTTADQSALTVPTPTASAPRFEDAVGSIAAKQQAPQDLTNLTESETDEGKVRSDSDWSSSMDDSKDEDKLPSHDTLRCAVHGMAVQGPVVFCLTACSLPANAGSSAPSASGKVSAQLLSFSGPGVLLQHTRPTAQLPQAVCGWGGLRAAGREVHVVGLAPQGALHVGSATDALADAGSGKFWAADDY